VALDASATLTAQAIGRYLYPLFLPQSPRPGAIYYDFLNLSLIDVP
jgi:hypothetical protein